MDRGLTQIEFGRRAGLSSRMMAYYEVQGGEPRPELLRKFAEILDVSVDALAGRQPLPKRQSATDADLRVWRRVRRIQELPPHDQKAVLKMIDAMADQAANRRSSG
jgi:transcriptional regulator with XRE-family HTH domain